MVLLGEDSIGGKPNESIYFMKLQKRDKRQGPDEGTQDVLIIQLNGCLSFLMLSFLPFPALFSLNPK
jgi:hypothetical protein